MARMWAVAAIFWGALGAAAIAGTLTPDTAPRAEGPCPAGMADADSCGGGPWPHSAVQAAPSWMPAFGTAVPPGAGRTAWWEAPADPAGPARGPVGFDGDTARNLHGAAILP